MTPELWSSLAKIAGSVLLLAVVLWATAGAGRALRLPAELSRKLIHVSLGLYCLLFPLIFTRAWEVTATCALAVGLFLLVRWRWRRLGEGLHGVKRQSWGEVLFAVSVALLFHLKDGHFILRLHGDQTTPQLWLYLLPLALLTLCDAASALIGGAYGRSSFQVGGGRKTWEGVAVFAVTAWLVALIVLLLFSDIARGDAVLLALVAALFGALFEGASWRGLDNLFIPIGLYVILADLAPHGTVVLATACAGFAVALIAVVLACRRFDLDRHVAASVATFFFCIAVFSGPPSVLTPAAAFAAWFFTRTPGPGATEEGLSLIGVSLAVALSFFMLSDLMATNTILPFNLAFAALAAAAAARFAASPARVVAVCLLAWLAMNVRVLLDPVTVRTLAFSAGGLLAILMAAGVARLLRRAGAPRPWLQVGGLSLTAGLAGLGAMLA